MVFVGKNVLFLHVVFQVGQVFLAPHKTGVLVWISLGNPIFMVLLVDAEHALVSTRFTFLSWEANCIELCTLEPMELLETHEALDTRTFGLTSVAMV